MLQPCSLPVPLSACRAEVCRISCICKMWARRAGRRNFPLKHLIFKRNEAHAGEQQQELGLWAPSTQGSAQHKASPRRFLCLLSKSGRKGAEISFYGEKDKGYSSLPLPWALPPSAALGDLFQ